MHISTRYVILMDATVDNRVLFLQVDTRTPPHTLARRQSAQIFHEIKL
jgi:hypothetical protein